VVAAFALTGAVVILAWFIGVYRPAGNRLSEVRDEVATAQGEEQSLRATLSRLESIDADRPALEAELRRLEAGVPGQPELANLILSLHDLATASEVDFLSITPALPSRDDAADFSTIALGITAEGRFFTILDLLNRLEDLDRVVVVDSMELTRVAPSAPTTTSTLPVGEGGAQAAGGVPLQLPATGTPGGPVLPGEAPRSPDLVVAASIDEALAQQGSTDHRVSVQLQARAFTTAAPAPTGAGSEESTTTTTTTTTTPAGGG
jgi:Tfp pilus assembly protein PilO